MPTRDTDTRPITLVDIPLVLRLMEKSVTLDCELIFTHNGQGVPLSSLLLPQRGFHTYISRSDKQQVVGQFRLKADETHAHLVYLAPHLEVDEEDTAWLHMLDGMAREAGKQGAHALLAEVEESSPLFETLRTAGYAVYARQEIWRREAGSYPLQYPALALTEATDDDTLGIQSLFATTVPSLVQQVAAPQSDMPGFIYRQDERIEAYIAYSEGRHGIYMIPYLHPDILSDAPAVLESALRMLPRAAKLPVSVCVRRYQDWVIEALAELDFVPYFHQAVMVKHITAGIRHAHFAPLPHQIEDSTRPIRPPTNGYTLEQESCWMIIDQEAVVNL